MIKKSENRLHPRKSVVVEHFQTAIADLLLEMAALQSNQNYALNRQVIDRFKALAGQAQQHAKDVLSQYSAPSKLLFEVRAGGETLDKADLGTLVLDPTVRTNLMNDLERVYGSLKALSASSATSSSSFFLFR